MKFTSILNHEAEPSLQWIEIMSSLHIPSFTIVGLPSKEISESRERVKAAIQSSGFEFPKRRIVINLSPAEIRKCGTGADLSIALTIMCHHYSLHAERLRITAWGELGLDGQLKSVSKSTRAVYTAWKNRSDFLIVPQSDLPEAHEALSLVGKCFPKIRTSLKILGAEHLKEAWEWIKKINENSTGIQMPSSPDALSFHSNTKLSASSLLPLTPALLRILCIAATGRHHLLLLGAKGTGKTKALDWLEFLQPHSSHLLQLQQKLVDELLFQGTNSLSHQSSVRVSQGVRPEALQGSAFMAGISPGLFTLAHGKMLIADEFPEWPRNSREALREPLETGRVTLSRSLQKTEFPAKFVLAATANFCPCGNYTVLQDQNQPPCGCTPRARLLYRQRFSGPVLDRIDACFCVTARVPDKDSRLNPLQIQQTVQKHVDRLTKKWGATPGNLSSETLERILRTHPKWNALLELNEPHNLRSRHKILKLALTIAEWSDSDELKEHHFFEAKLYRPESFLNTLEI